MTASRTGDRLLRAYRTASRDAAAAHARGVPARRRGAQQLAGDAPLARLAPASCGAFSPCCMRAGCRARSLARMLSGWRAFYRFAIEHEPRAQGQSLRGPEGAEVAAAAAGGSLARRGGAPGRRSPTNDALAVRDRALLELAYSSGLRCPSCAGLDLAALDPVRRRSARPGQGREGADRSRRRACARCAPGLARAAGRLPVARAARRCSCQRSGRRLSAARDPAAPRRVGDQAGPRRARAPAHAAPFVRVAPARNPPATCARCRKCWATRASRARRSTRTSTSSTWPRSTIRRTRGRERRAEQSPRSVDLSRRSPLSRATMADR